MFKRKYGRDRSLNAFAQRVRGKAQARRNASETQRDGTRLRAECDAAEAELGVSLRDLERAGGESDLGGFKAEAAMRSAEKSIASAAALLDENEILQSELDADLSALERDVKEALRVKGGK